MSSWEQIADEVAPLGSGPRGLAAGAHRRALLDEVAPNGAQDDNEEIIARLTPPLAPRLISPPACAFDATLDGALRGTEITDANGSRFYYIAREATEFETEFNNLNSYLGDSVEYIAKKTKGKIGIQDLLFMDIETTGLSSSTPLFLIGTLRAREGAPALLELFLARCHEEERAALAAFHPLAEGKTLVTFNGKHFDWPYIEGRSLRCDVKIAKPRANFDLLHHARRRWKKLVPNCRLQTLEYYLCGRQRVGDIESSRIPAQYEQFAELYTATRRGAHLLAPVVHHNIWDVLTMADLLRKLQLPR